MKFIVGCSTFSRKPG